MQYLLIALFFPVWPFVLLTNKPGSISVCFTCSELRYYLNGEVFWQSYFNPHELKDFVKKLYPKDAKIQSLSRP